MQRTFILGGQAITIQAVGQPLDHAFDRLHEAYFGNTALPWEEFTAAATQHFDAHPTDPDEHNAYFNNFTVLWRNFLGNRRYEEAEHIWELALTPALEWEHAQPPRRLHKGTPYYFWAMTALLKGDIDRGYLLAHQALDEDIRTTGQPTPDSPGYALVSLNYERVDQAFREWVIAQAQFVHRLLGNYITIHGRQFTLDQVRQRFLTSPPSTETLFLLTYTIARLMRLDLLPEHTVNNEFAGQLELNLLFDITLVIDNAIKAKNPTTRLANGKSPTFIHHAEHLLSAATQPLNSQQLGEINQQYNADFDNTLKAALDGTLTIANHAALTRLQCDVALAYGLRNHGAHNTGTATTIWTRFPEVQQALFRTLFATIDHCY